MAHVCFVAKCLQRWRAVRLFCCLGGLSTLMLGCVSFSLIEDSVGLGWMLLKFLRLYVPFCLAWVRGPGIEMAITVRQVEVGRNHLHKRPYTRSPLSNQNPGVACLTLPLLVRSGGVRNPGSDDISCPKKSLVYIDEHVHGVNLSGSCLYVTILFGAHLL